MDLREKIARELWVAVFEHDAEPPEPFSAADLRLSDAFRAQYLRYADRILELLKAEGALGQAYGEGEMAKHLAKMSGK